MGKEQFSSMCVIIHAGRVGSTVLASRLCSLPIIVAGEIFNRSVNKMPDWTSKYDYLELFDHMLVHAVEYGSPYMDSLGASNHCACSYLFEYKPYHPGCGAGIVEAVKGFYSRGVSHFVFLHRKNYLRRYVSYLVAVSSGTWHVAHKSGSPHKVKIDVNHCSDLEIGLASGKLTELIDVYYTQFVPSIEAAIAPRRHLVINYEEHIQPDPNIGFDCVRRFLGLEAGPEPVDMGYRKQNDFPLSEIIENYEEVSDVVAGHGYRHLLV